MADIELLKCNICGGELTSLNVNTYRCACCGNLFARKQENLESVLKKTLGEEKYARVSAARQNLWAAMHEEYVSSEACVSYARELKSYVPSDYYASFAEVANGNNDRALSKFLNESSVEDMKTYADAVLDFMLKQGAMTPSTVTAVCSYINRAYPVKTSPEYIKYINRYEEEATNVDEGIYDLTMPRDVFIAYSSEDINVVTELCEYLESQEITCFTSLRNLRHGRGAADNYDRALNVAMDSCRIIVFVSSLSSRKLGCEALRKELPHVRQKDLDNAPAELKKSYEKLPIKYKKERVEYLIDDYGDNTPADKKVKEFFSGYEWCLTIEDVADRVFTYLTSEPEIYDGVGINIVPTDMDEKIIQQLIDKALEQRKTERREDENKKNQGIGENKKTEEIGKQEQNRYIHEAERNRKAEENSGRENKEERSKKEKELLRSKWSKNLEFTEYENGYAVNRGICNDIEIIIPFEYNGKPVISIATNAFFNCEKIKSVIIPDSVTSIGDCAFWNCAELTSVVIPNSVTSIGRAAFENCTSLKSIIIPNHVTLIDSCLFLGCTSLISIAIPDSVTEIEISAFGNCMSLTSVVIPNSVIKICENAFSGCSSLKSITIPSSITAISKGLFFDCTSISSFIIPESVNSIGSSAFEGCSSLTSIAIPDSVTSIGSDVFSGCASLTYVSISNSITSISRGMFNACVSLTSVVIPESVTIIGDSAFWGCISLKSITIPTNVSFIEKDAFEECDRLLEIYNLSSLDIKAGNKDNGKVAFFSMNVYRDAKKSNNFANTKDGYEFYRHGSKYYLIDYKGNSTNLVLPSKIDGKDYEIYKYAFSYCKLLTKVTIPPNIKTIANGTFEGCTSLKSIIMPASISSIQDRAFSDCTSLWNIDIPNSVTSIGDYAFAHCKSLMSITIPPSVTFIGKFAFWDCRSLTSVVMSKFAVIVPDYVFSGCTSLQYVTIGSDVTRIGNSAFHNCTSLINVKYSGSSSDWSKIIIEDGNDAVRDAIKYYNEDLELGEKSKESYNAKNRDGKQEKKDTDEKNTMVGLRPKISVGLEYKLEGINYTVSGLGTCKDKNIIIPNKINGNIVTAISVQAFYKRLAIESVIIPNSVTSIGISAFNCCTNLIKVTIPDSVVSIGCYAFYCCRSLVCIKIPNMITSIGWYSFYGCSSLKTVIIGRGIKEIQKAAFRHCSSLTDVYYYGSLLEWRRISIKCPHIELDKAKIHFLSEIKPTESGNFWHYDEDGNPVSW